MCVCVYVCVYVSACVLKSCDNIGDAISWRRRLRLPPFAGLPRRGGFKSCAAALCP